MSEVTILEGENIERAVRRFKKLCQRAGILADLRKHRHFETPAMKRKRKLATASRRGRGGRNG